MLLRKSQCVYFALLALLLIGNVIFLILNNFKISSYYFLTASLFIIFPFISLFYILFLNIKKVDYRARKYDETGLISHIIFGSLWLFIFSKVNIYLDLYICYLISIISFIIICIIFTYLNIKKGEIKTDPKIISNKWRQ